MAVGSAADVEGLIGPETRVIRLNGETLLPGFQDAHIHPVYGGLARRSCYLHDVAGEEAYLETVAAYAAAHPEAEWITGDGWTYAAFAGGMPHRDGLDRVLPDRPAFITAYDGHSAWVNSRALELAGVTSATPDPAHGRIFRDADGSPSGALSEDAKALVERLVPPPSQTDLVEAVLESQRHLHALGITAWHDAGFNPEWLPAYHDLARSGRLTARVVAAQQWWPWGGAKEADPMPRLLAAREASRIGRLRAHAVKFWVDGVFENGSALVLEPYLGPDGIPSTDTGTPNYEADELNAAVIELESQGFDCHFHAIGDAAVRQALDAVAAARAAHGPRAVRHSIAHLELIDPGDIPRFAELDVAANLQTFWAHDEAETRTIQFPLIGPARYHARYAFGDLDRAGARLAAGSDWTVTTANPLEQIEVALRRIYPTQREDPPWRPEQRLDLDTMLRAFTIGSAWVNRLEADTGTIEVGKLADLVVLDRDLRAVLDGRVADAEVLMTFMEGEEVYAA
jgi:predicted amidohydrolase YtcJ